MAQEKSERPGEVEFTKSIISPTKKSMINFHSRCLGSENKSTFVLFPNYTNPRLPGDLSSYSLPLVPPPAVGLRRSPSSWRDRSGWVAGFKVRTKTLLPSVSPVLTPQNPLWSQVTSRSGILPLPCQLTEGQLRVSEPLCSS